MSKFTYIVEVLRRDFDDDKYNFVFPYSSMKAAWEDNQEELGWSLDKLKRHDWSNPIVSRDGRYHLHRTPPPMSMGDYNRLLEKALAYEWEEE